MTEAEWFACGDPLAMLAFLCVDSDSRKALLLTQACIRRVQGDVSERCFAWGELAGRIADGEGASDLLNNEWESVESELNALDSRQSSNGGGRFYALLSILVVGWNDPTVWETGDVNWESERVQHSSIIRDIFGNPFRPVTLSPEWRTDTAVALARQMYESRDFGAMPILADALQDAGCDNEDVLNHCRGDGPHVRGCWVVDLVLGKQ